MDRIRNYLLDHVPKELASIICGYHIVVIQSLRTTRTIPLHVDRVIDHISSYKDKIFIKLNPMWKYINDKNRMDTYTMSSNSKNCNELMPLTKHGTVHVVGDKLFIHVSSWETRIVDPTTMETLKIIDLTKESTEKLCPLNKSDVDFDINSSDGISIRNASGQLVACTSHGHFKEIRHFNSAVVFNGRIYVSVDGKIFAYNPDGTGFHTVVINLHRSALSVYGDMLLVCNMINSGPKFYMFDKYENWIKTVDGIEVSRHWTLVGNSIWHVTNDEIVVTEFIV